VDLKLDMQTKRVSDGPLEKGGPKDFLEMLRERSNSLSIRQSISQQETGYEYIVQPGDTLWKIGTKIFGEDPYQIAKDNGITNPDLIYPGQKFVIKRSTIPTPQLVVASWYGKEYHNRPTASGERFDMFQYTLAHKSLPFGTIVKLFNPENGRVSMGRINDRGPFIQGRDIDLSYGLARQLDFVDKGVGKLIMEIL
jgi:rare lipoprotein A